MRVRAQGEILGLADAFFLASQLALIAFGLPAFFHPLLRRLPLAARTGAAFLLGALLLTVWTILLSLAEVRWRGWLLGSGPLLAALLLARWARRRPGEQRAADSIAGAPRIAAATLIAVALAHFTLRVITGRASSVDYALFWGVKALRFAALGGFDNELARWAFAIHTHPNYPPLFPLTLVWGVMTTGRLPWLGAFLTSVIWFALTLPLLYGLLRLRIEPPRALGVTTFWAVAMAASLGHSFSAGNAETMLIAYLTVGVAALLIESRDDALNARWIAGLSIAGAVATKFEALIAWALIVVAAFARDLLWRKKGMVSRTVPLLLIPALAYGLWAAYLMIHDIPLGDPTRNPARIHFIYVGSVVREMIEYLDMGSFGLAWVVPPALLLLTRDPLRRTDWAAALPALVLAVGLLLAFFVYYAQRPYDPGLEISWTLPRLAQPALSAWILAAGVILSPREPVRLGRG